MDDHRPSTCYRTHSRTEQTTLDSVGYFVRFSSAENRHRPRRHYILRLSPFVYRPTRACVLTSTSWTWIKNINFPLEHCKARHFIDPTGRLILNWDWDRTETDPSICPSIKNIKTGPYFSLIYLRPANRTKLIKNENQTGLDKTWNKDRL